LFGNVDDTCNVNNRSGLAGQFGIEFNHDDITTVSRPDLPHEWWARP
jgi:hypothetical protein